METLLLIPTVFEKSKLSPDTMARLESVAGAIEICGFGLVAATAQTVRLISLHSPKRVILIGVAGLYSTESKETYRIGDACIFDRVACYGIGVGHGSRFQSAAQLGWNQWQTKRSTDDSDDILELEPLGCQNSVTSSLTLLSVTATSSNQEEAMQKIRFQPQAIAEDMEGYGVAMACQLLGVPLTIARGFSNWVGDRNHQNWQVAEAMTEASNLLISRLEKNSL